MNRHARRAVASKQRGADLDMYLALHCAGPFSQPTPQECDRSVNIKMPFTHEELRSSLWARHGWFVTVISEPGATQMRFTVLCPTCADALIPDLVSVAKRHMPGSA
jgi:hypothetical protein